MLDHVGKPYTGDPVASLSGVTLELGGRRLVGEIDLDVSSDGLTVVMGPNGAGKSLLLRLLHGLLQPSSGSVHWSTAEGKRPRQAMVFQKPVLLRRSTAANIDYVLGTGTDRARRRDELLELVGLHGLARQPARLLSGGEQQRLALARALATDPQILFLDEATASLDPASVQLIEQVIRGARKDGMRIIMVTHDVFQARRLADEVWFMHRGRIVENGPAGAFFDNPVSPAAKAFLRGEIMI